MYLKLDDFLRPPSPPPTDEPEAVQLTGESSPIKWAQYPSVADYVLVVQCLKSLQNSDVKP